MTYELSVRAMRREDLASVGLVLDSTELFPSSMLNEMAEPFLMEEAAEELACLPGSAWSPWTSDCQTSLPVCRSRQSKDCERFTGSAVAR